MSDPPEAAKTERPPVESATDTAQLQTFLQEVRVLLPGTQILAGFLLTVPLQQRYEALNETQRGAFVVTFLSTTLALVCFLAPAVYHRVATPVRHIRRFIAFGTRFVLVGLSFFALSTALSAQLVLSMVLGERRAGALSGAIVVLLLLTWGVLPKLRVHERAPEPPS